jgi:putative transposase
LASRLKYCERLINDGYLSTTKILELAQIHKTAWYRYKHGSIDKRKFNRGKPIPGFSYDKYANKILDEEIVNKMLQIRNEKHTIVAGGYKKIKHYLCRRFGYIVNYKKVYRLCKENNLCLPKQHNKKPRRHISINRLVTRPNQVWEFDIKYGYIHGENRFFYILVYIDVFSRMIMHFHIGLQCKAKNLAATFSTALRKHNIDPNDNLVIRSDNGPQMSSKQFYKYLITEVQHKVEHEFIPCATPNKNAHVESFYSIVESEFIYPNYFTSFKDVYYKFVDFINFYCKERVHGSLRYHTPDEIIKLYKTGGILPKMKKISI